MNLSRTVLRERGFSRDTVQMLQLPAMQRKLCNTCGSWLITLNVESLVAISITLSSRAVNVAGSVLFGLKKMWSGKSAWRNDIFNHHFVSQSVDNIRA